MEPFLVFERSILLQASNKSWALPANENDYWTKLCVKTMAKIPDDIFM